MKSKIDTLPDFESIEDLRSHLGRIPRSDLMALQDELDRLHQKSIAPYSSMKSLFHGAPNKVLKIIREQGFRLTKGQRAGILGGVLEVQNQAIFLSEDKGLARAFGANKDPYGGSDTGVLEIKADINKTFDMTQWSKVPAPIQRLGLKLISDYEGKRVRKPRQSDMFWLLDQVEFVNLLKSLGYDSVRFLEAKSTKRALGLPDSSGETVAVFDPSRLHLMPAPLVGLRGLFSILKSRKASPRKLASLYLITGIERLPLQRVGSFALDLRACLLSQQGKHLV